MKQLERELPVFAFMDVVRRVQANALGGLGLGARECDYRVVASGSNWRLRQYSGAEAPTSILIVAAPIKRPYIWDLSPRASAIRYCLEHQLRVFLLEWVAPAQAGGNYGLDEAVAAVAACTDRVRKEKPGGEPFLIGHSLGGTLAAIAAAGRLEGIRGLALLGAPLCFEPGTSRFADTVASIDAAILSEASVVPGSFLSLVSAIASPETFIWSRLGDAALSLTDPAKVDIHTRVERWALDEVPLPGKLVYQIFQWLYKENQLCRGMLRIAGKRIASRDVVVPVLAVVDTADDIAPLESVKPFLDAVGTRDVRIVECPGETGVALQHLAVLIGRGAHTRVWPEIVQWLTSRR